MSNKAFSGILQGSLTATFLVQQHGYYYRCYNRVQEFSFLVVKTALIRRNLYEKGREIQRLIFTRADATMFA